MSWRAKGERPLLGYLLVSCPSSSFLLSLDDPKVHQADLALLRGAFADDKAAAEKAEAFYFAKTSELIKEHSYSLSGVEGRCIDIVVCSQVVVRKPSLIVSLGRSRQPSTRLLRRSRYCKYRL